MSRQDTKLSILISSYERPHLFRRCLFSIANNIPNVPFEVIVCDDGSLYDMQNLLKKFSTRFPWKLIRLDTSKFTEATGIQKFHNNPALSNNIAFKHSSGDLIALMGNEVIAYRNCFSQLLADIPTNNEPFNVLSTTYDVPQEVLDKIDSYGQNLNDALVDKYCKLFPLQDITYPSDVTNYLSISSREVWEKLNGYDERLLGGIACEDSCWIRRCRTLPGYRHILSKGISLHQYHGGMSRYYQPDPKVIDMVKWNQGLKINRAIYHSWDGQAKNTQTWEPGVLGVKEIITSGY